LPRRDPQPRRPTRLALGIRARPAVAVAHKIDLQPPCQTMCARPCSLEAR
jgi:hypothetical protein